MKKFLFNIHVYLCVCSSLAVLLLTTSCSGIKQTLRDDAIELIPDPITGEQVFIRENDTKPYGINVSGIVKARKEQKKNKRKEILENYDKANPIGTKDEH